MSSVARYSGRCGGKNFQNKDSSEKSGSDFLKPRHIPRYPRRNLRGASFWKDDDDDNSKSSGGKKSWADRCDEHDDDLHSPIQRDNFRSRRRECNEIQENGDGNFISRPNRKRGNLKEMFSLAEFCRTSDSGSDSVKRRSLLRSSEDGISTTSSSMNSSDNEQDGEKTRKYETDQVVLRRRQKQIDYGKNTKAYKAYLEAVPKDKREIGRHVITPRKHIMYSRRSWDNQVKIWRKRLHEYDPESEEDETEVDLSDMIATLSPK